MDASLNIFSSKFVLFLSIFVLLCVHSCLYVLWTSPLGNRYGFLEVQFSEVGEIFEIKGFGVVTYYILILFIFVIILIFREVYQIIKQKKRYFYALENLLEWFVIALAFVSIIPRSYFKGSNINQEFQRHIAALTLLIAFMQVYLLLVRVVPNTPIPVYINMFTTVLKTYTLILMSYLVFIVIFAYSFFLIFSARDNQQSDAATRWVLNFQRTFSLVHDIFQLKLIFHVKKRSKGDSMTYNESELYPKLTTTRPTDILSQWPKSY